MGSVNQKKNAQLKKYGPVSNRIGRGRKKAKQKWSR